MGSVPFSNNNLSQIFFALLPEKNSGQNIGKREKLSEIQDLLKLGVNVNAELYSGYTPICKVIEEGGSKTLVETLVHHGAIIDINLPLGQEWVDIDGKVIQNKIYALARQRCLRCQDKESQEIQQLIYQTLIQNSKISAHSGSLPNHSPQTPQNEMVLNEAINSSTLQFKNKLNGFNHVVEDFTKKKIFIFDFENTLVNGHFHNILKNMGVANGRASADLVDFLIEKYGFKHKEWMLCLFRDILRNGDCISIASSSRYPETIHAVLDALGLSAEERANIFYDPPDLNSAPDITLGKNLDILKSMIYFEVIDVNAIYLIDCEQTNLQLAKSRLNLPESNLIKVDIEKPEEKSSADKMGIDRLGNGMAALPSYIQVLQRLVRKNHLMEEPKLASKPHSFVSVNGTVPDTGHSIGPIANGSNTQSNNFAFIG